MKRWVRALRRHLLPFLIGAPIMAVFLWVGAWIAWQLDPVEAGPAVPPWFHNGWYFLVMSILGGFIEICLLVLLCVGVLGARWVGGLAIDAIRHAFAEETPPRSTRRKRAAKAEA